MTSDLDKLIQDTLRNIRNTSSIKPVSVELLANATELLRLASNDNTTLQQLITVADDLLHTNNEYCVLVSKALIHIALVRFPVLSALQQKP